MLGAEVTELIQGYVIAMTLEATEADLIAAMFPHPTLSEAMHEAALDAYGIALHMSRAVMDFLRTPAFCSPQDGRGARRLPACRPACRYRRGRIDALRRRDAVLLSAKPVSERVYP